jgi:hypothetical protein
MKLEMTLADAKQKQIIAILTKGDKDFKRELVVDQTKDSMKSSTSDLTFAQANDIILKLGGTPVVNQWTKFNYNKKTHMNILSLLMQLGWQFYDHEKSRNFADTSKLAHWLQTKAPVKKPLNDMSHNELSKTIYALENMLKKDLKKTPLRQ